MSQETDYQNQPLDPQKQTLIGFAVIFIMLSPVILAATIVNGHIGIAAGYIILITIIFFYVTKRTQKDQNHNNPN